MHLFIWLTDIMRTLCVSVYDRTCVCMWLDVHKQWGLCWGWGERGEDGICN